MESNDSQAVLARYEEELKAVRAECQELKKQLQAHMITEESLKDDDVKVKYYTGLYNFSILKAVLELVQGHIPTTSKSALNPFQQVLLVFMRLRLNLGVQDLAYRFNIGKSTVSRIFLTVINVMSARLRFLILWPQKEQLQKTLPMSFRQDFGNKVAVIIDCFEVFIDRPSNVMARAQTWSTYKHHNTVKFLIGITLQGVICYVSKAWGGRVSDKHLTENCGFLTQLLPNDVVLADRGFNIAESVGMHCAQVKLPAFTRGKKQLSPCDVESTRKLANLRIHVGRVIGTIRQKYTMLQSTLPIDYLHHQHEEDYTTIDKIVTVCCAITNLSDSAVPSD